MEYSSAKRITEACRAVGVIEPESVSFIWSDLTWALGWLEGMRTQPVRGNASNASNNRLIGPSQHAGLAGANAPTLAPAWTGLFRTPFQKSRRTMFFKI